MNLKMGDYIALSRGNNLDFGVFKKRNPKTIAYYNLHDLDSFRKDLGLIPGKGYTSHIEESRTIKVTYEQILEQLESTSYNTHELDCLEGFEELLKIYKYK